MEYLCVLLLCILTPVSAKGQKFLLKTKHMACDGTCSPNLIKTTTGSIGGSVCIDDI